MICNLIDLSNLGRNGGIGLISAAPGFSNFYSFVGNSKNGTVLCQKLNESMDNMKCLYGNSGCCQLYQICGNKVFVYK